MGSESYSLEIFIYSKSSKFDTQPEQGISKQCTNNQMNRRAQGNMAREQTGIQTSEKSAEAGRRMFAIGMAVNGTETSLP